MIRVRSFLVLLFILGLPGCGLKESASEKKTEIKEEVAKPDTLKTAKQPVQSREQPEPEPEPTPVPSADPDFTDTFSDSLEAYSVEFLSDTAGLQYIRENVLVRIDINHSQIERLKGTFEEEDDFYAVADDNMYYMSDLEEKATALGIEVVNANERYLGFVGINDSAKQLYDLEKDSLHGVYWTFIAFNTTRGTRQITNIVDADMEKVAHYIQKDVYPSILLEDTTLWNLPTRLAAQDAITDADFWQFLKDYREAARALSGENLYTHPELKYYDSHASSYDKPEHPLAYVLRREVRKLGYEFANYQGDPYFSQSPPFIREHLYPKVTDTMREFLDIFLLSYTLAYWEEGSLTVEPEEIARHIVLWEGFAAKHPDFVQPDYAATEAATLVSYLIDEGSSYNPYFADQDSILDDRFIRGMEYLIQEARETASGLRVSEYYHLLETNGFKKTDTVANYVRAYLKELRSR